MNIKTKEIIVKIGELFGDTSVSQEDTLNSLEEIQEELDARIGAIKEDVRNKHRVLNES
jgi:hypothetical protein